MKKSGIIWLFLLFAIQNGKAQQTGIQFIEDKSWGEILELSKKQDKLIFLDCYTTWCGPCKMMAKEVFPLKEVGDFMNPNFINVKFDMEAGEGIDLYKTYKKYIPGFPTYLLINSKGEVVHQVAGSASPDKFISKINDGLQSKSWVVYSQKYNEGQRDWAFLRSYLTLLEDAFQSSLIKEVTKEVLPKLTLEVIKEDSSAYRIFRKYWRTTDGNLLYTVLSSPGIYRKYKDSEREINDWGGRIYSREVDKYIEKSMKPEEFDDKIAKEVIDEIRGLHITGRENMITLMLLSTAVANKDGDEFLRIYNFATEIGHLRYNERYVGNWVSYLARFTSDKQKLKKYLACIKFADNESLIAPLDYRNYAFILERMGENEKAKSYYKKADDNQAIMNERMKEFMK